MTASAEAKPQLTVYKDLYEIGEIPPLGHVPSRMYAWAIRKERHGEPEAAMRMEVVPTWPLDSHDVLVLVMAAGVNYNGVWAALGKPISPIDGHKNPYHIAGSDASGIVYAIGSKVKRWAVGDEVVIHCNQDDGDDEECNGGDPMFSPSQRIWGYETPDGSFAQFCRVQDRQLLERPRHLTWEESASYVLVLATAYRMLFGHRPHVIRPGHNILVCDASGVGAGGQARRHGGDLRRHHRLQSDHGRALSVDAPEARAGLAFRQPLAGSPGQQAGGGAAHRPRHVGSLPLDADPQGAHAHVEERAQARQHGRAGQRPHHGAADLRRR